jgi:hypothetical protein
MHLIIPFASCAAEACQQTLQKLRLPHLERLLSRLAPANIDSADEFTRSPAHERALAAARGLQAPDGQLPWAAVQAQQLGLGSTHDAWAFVTPCHWHVAADHISMRGLEGLALQEGESRALLETLQPWFAGDGIRLHYLRADQWLGNGEIFRGLATASLDRVIGRNVDAWMPEGAQAAPLRRLQNEMQMLLYHHPANDLRAERGLLPINSFWLSGTGALPAAPQPAVEPDVRVAEALRGPALAGDWAGWALAWQQVDQADCAALTAALAAGERVQLTLCGERAAQRFGPERRSAVTRFLNTLARKPLWNGREPL